MQLGKYQAGLATNLEVQSAIRDLARVRAESVITAFDLEVAYRELENVLAPYQNQRIESTLQRLLPAATPRLRTSRPPHPTEGPHINKNAR